jgi:membrane-associated protease RseP (regulator of RpoE activity)
LFFLLMTLPLIVLFLLPGGGLVTGRNALWFFLAMLICFSLLQLVLGASPRARRLETAGLSREDEPVPEPHVRMFYPEQQPDVVREVMDVQLATEDNGVQAYQGPLRVDSEVAYRRLKESFSTGVVPLLQQDERHGSLILLLPQPVEKARLERPIRPWLHWLLFGLTVLTTTWAGAAQQGVNLLERPMDFTVGLPYALGLLAILGVHELGHYFAGRLHGMSVTPPFFIPVPFALGTFGAFIQLRTPPENRRSLFDMAIAGPLAGLVVAIPILLIGLQQSQVITGTLTAEQSAGLPRYGVMSAGSSISMALMAKLVFGAELQESCLIVMSPMAFAGWLGLFITALNLLPIGQLDGGHVTRAMFGLRIGRTISSIAMWSLLLLGLFVWPGLLMWALIVFFIAGRGTPPLEDVTPISPGRRLLGYTALIILLLILVPLPQALWSEVGIDCPYVKTPRP